MLDTSIRESKICGYTVAFMGGIEKPRCKVFFVVSSSDNARRASSMERALEIELPRCPVVGLENVRH